MTEGKNSRALLAASVAGMLAAGSVLLAQSAQAHEGEANEEKASCYGINKCKGAGDCGGKGHACAGKNACAGQGYISLNKDTCLKIQGGRLTEEPEQPAS